MRRTRLRQISIERKQQLIHEVNSIVVLKDQSIAYAVSDVIKILNLSDGSLIQTLIGHKGRVFSLAAMPDGQLVSSNPNEIISWDVTTGQIISRLNQTSKSYSISLLAFEQDKIVLSSKDNHQLFIWDTREEQIVMQLESSCSHTDSVSALAKLEMNAIASGSKDTTVKIWTVDCLDGRYILKKTFTHHTSTVSCLVAMPEKKLVSASEDGTIIVWDTENYQLHHKLKGHSQAILSLSLLSDGITLASASRDKTIKVWDTSNWQLVNTLTDHTKDIILLESTKDGRLISGSNDKSIILWHHLNAQSKSIFEF